MDEDLLLPLLRRCRSRRESHPGHEVTAAEPEALPEEARWAPSGTGPS